MYRQGAKLAKLNKMRCFTEPFFRNLLQRRVFLPGSSTWRTWCLCGKFGTLSSFPELHFQSLISNRSIAGSCSLSCSRVNGKKSFVEKNASVDSAKYSAGLLIP